MSIVCSSGKTQPGIYRVSRFMFYLSLPCEQQSHHIQFFTESLNTPQADLYYGAVILGTQIVSLLCALPQALHMLFSSSCYVLAGVAPIRVVARSPRTCRVCIWDIFLIFSPHTHRCCVGCFFSLGWRSGSLLGMIQHNTDTYI